MRDSSAEPPRLWRGEQHVEWSYGDSYSSMGTTLGNAHDLYPGSNPAGSYPGTYADDGHPGIYLVDGNPANVHNAGGLLGLRSVRYGLNCSWSQVPSDHVAVLLSVTDNWPANAALMIRVRQVGGFKKHKNCFTGLITYY